MMVSTLPTRFSLAHGVDQGKFHVCGRERELKYVECASADRFQILLPFVVQHSHNDVRRVQFHVPQVEKIAIGPIREIFIAKTECGRSVGKGRSGLRKCGASQSVDIQTLENPQ